MYKAIKFVLALLFFGSVVYGTGRWSLTGNFNIARSGAQSVMLTDSKVIAFGGISTTALLSYEIFDPATGIWQAALYDTAFKGNDHTTAVLLPNGNVLLESNYGYLWNYNPTVNIWQNTDFHWQTSLSGSIRECANLLNNGKLLLVDRPGGVPCYIYEWEIDTLRRITDNIDGLTNLYDRSDAAEVRLPDGKVMIIGGYRLDMAIYKSCEIFNPGTETFSYTDSLLTGLVRHVAVLLRTSPQKVLTAGGNTTTSQVYDLTTQKWSYSGTQNVSPRTVPAMALLPNGKALLMGGSGLNSCEVYDPSTGIWSNTDPMTVNRCHFSATILPTGKVLAHGDYNTAGDARTEIYDPAEGAGWTTKAQLNTSRCAATATLLPIQYAANCSSNVIIVGGEDNNGTALASCELFSHQKDTVVYTCALNNARTHHTANLMPFPNGEVLVTGGKNGGGALSSCEMYEVATQIWTNMASMSTPRFDHTSTLLKDGRVFVTGGEGTSYLNSCEIYNSGIWTSTGAMSTARARHSAVLLLNGNVMVTGGETSTGTPTNSCEIYNPATGIWTSASSMTTARSWHSAVLLQSGKILVIGGQGAGGTTLASCEIYNPNTGTWTQETNLKQARYLHSATMTYAGLVMVTGGKPGNLTSCELYDPATHEWTNTGTLASGRNCFSTILVPGIKPFVYAIGGSSSTDVLGSIERFDFGLGYQSDWQSRIHNFNSITHISSSMNIKGSLFRDISEADGGNHCHVSNQDHPIISLVRIGGGNFQGNGGGDIITMPLSSYWDTANTIVCPQISDFQGYYRLWSIVNGIPCLWYEVAVGIEESKLVGTDYNLSISQNPFSKSTVIRYQVPAISKVSLAIYDITGSCLKTLVNEQKPAGSYTATLNAKELKTGIYFLTLSTGTSKTTKKLILIK